MSFPPRTWYVPFYSFRIAAGCRETERTDCTYAPCLCFVLAGLYCNPTKRLDDGIQLKHRSNARISGTLRVREDPRIHENHSCCATTPAVGGDRHIESDTSFVDESTVSVVAIFERHWVEGYQSLLATTGALSLPSKPHCCSHSNVDDRSGGFCRARKG